MSKKFIHMMNYFFGSSLVLVLLSQQATCDPHSWAENVCNNTIPVKKDIVIEQPIEYEIKVSTMCGILPCTSARKEIKTDQSIKTIIQHIVKSTCCPGYVETPDRLCAPVCLQTCTNGKCVAPNVCKCYVEPNASSPGFVGPTCSRFVCQTENKWGSKCDKDCNCSTNSYCSADTGKCTCYPGWRGVNCNIECDQDNLEECGQYNRLPPIVEPEANLMSSENLILARQKSEALVLDDDVRITADEGQIWINTSPNYLVLVLSFVCVLLLIAMFTFKKRHDRIRNELYRSVASSANSYYSQGSPPAYYTVNEGSSSLDLNQSADSKLDKNLSFAAATRRFLLGQNLDTLLVDKSESRKKIIYNPRVESNLITSQKSAQQNLYSDVVLTMNNDLAKPPPLPAPNATYCLEDHIYQVPNSIAPSSPSPKPDVTQSNTLGTLNQEESDDLSNIYEEIKPKK